MLLFFLLFLKQSNHVKEYTFFPTNLLRIFIENLPETSMVNLWFAIFIGTLIFCLTSERKEGRKRNHELRVRHQWGKRGRNFRSSGGKKKLFVVDVAKKERYAVRISHSKNLRQSFENNQM